MSKGAAAGVTDEGSSSPVHRAVISTAADSAADAEVGTMDRMAVGIEGVALLLLGCTLSGLPSMGLDSGACLMLIIFDRRQLVSIGVRG